MALQRPSIPIDVLFIDCKGFINPSTKDKLITAFPPSDQEGFNTLVNKVAPWARSCEYVHRRFSSSGGHFVVSYGVRFPQPNRWEYIARTMKMLHEFRVKRILVTTSVDSVPYNPCDELYIPASYHPHIETLVNISAKQRWKCNLLVDPSLADVVPLASSLMHTKSSTDTVMEEVRPTIPIASINAPSSTVASLNLPHLSPNRPELGKKLTLTLVKRDGPNSPVKSAPTRATTANTNPFGHYDSDAESSHKISSNSPTEERNTAAAKKSALDALLCVTEGSSNEVKAKLPSLPTLGQLWEAPTRSQPEATPIWSSNLISGTTVAKSIQITATNKPFPIIAAINPARTAISDPSSLTTPSISSPSAVNQKPAQTNRGLNRHSPQPEDIYPGITFQSHIDAFDDTFDYRGGLHAGIQSAIKGICTKFNIARPSYGTREPSNQNEGNTPMNNWVSGVWALAEELGERRHEEFVDRYHGLKNKELEEKRVQDELFGRGPEPNGRPLKKRRVGNRTVDLSRINENQRLELELSGIPPSIYFETAPQLDIRWAIESKGDGRTLRPEHVDLSQEWQAIRDWEMVRDGVAAYDERTKYLICEFSSYLSSTLEEHFRNQFKRKPSLRTACRNSLSINIIPELEKLPQKQFVSFCNGEVGIDWPREIKLGIKSEDEEKVVRVEGSSTRKPMSEIISSWYLSRKGPSKFVISFDSTSHEEMDHITRMYTVHVRAPSAMEVADVLRGTSLGY